jgi:hypothetical protein
LHEESASKLSIIGVLNGCFLMSKEILDKNIDLLGKNTYNDYVDLIG